MQVVICKERTAGMEKMSVSQAAYWAPFLKTEIQLNNSLCLPVGHWIISLVKVGFTGL